MTKENSKQKQPDYKKFDLDKVYGKVTLFLILSPVIVYIFAFLVSALFDLRFFPLSAIADESAWIGYAGSVIGGLVTMVAVMSTLHYEEKRRLIEKEENDAQRRLEKEEFVQQRRHDKAIAILPVIQLSSTASHEKVFEGLHKYREFVIENVSVNHINELLLTDINVCWLEPSKNHPGSYDMIYSDDNYFDENTVHLSLFPSKTNYKFRVYLNEPNDIDHIKKLRNPGTECIITFSLRYKDILGIYTYSHEYKLILEQTVDPTRMVYADGHLITYYQFYNETNEFEIQSE